MIKNVAAVETRGSYTHEDFVPEFGKHLRDMTAAAAVAITNGSKLDLDTIYDRLAANPDATDPHDLLSVEEAKSLPLAESIIQATTELVWESFTVDGPAPEAPHIGEFLK